MSVDVAYAELGRILLDRTPLNAVLQRVAELARDCVPGADEASVTVVQGKRATSVAFTGSLAVQLDERQYELGFGPCMDAAMSGQTIAIADTGAGDEAYPGYSEVAARAGVRAALSVGLAVPGRTVGALNLYDTHGESVLGERSREVAAVFAGHAAIALTNAMAVESTRELAEQLQRAMVSRAVIEQAKGVIAVQRGVTPEQAFALLSRRSQDSNRKLAELAGEVVEAVTEGRDTGW
ncbi:GAF and ANTAR domain-containing protein [Quadrisphaera sp. KR29]|uniref:GAF and ANTAR domain-containing protein n=1 Tax=Quadrisphaera sp. KR29 TaxID=3461391 RepID=UPI0040445B63